MKHNSLSIGPGIALALLLGALLLAPAATHAAKDGSEIEEHVRILADPKLEGRMTGSEGARQAASYITEQLKALGVKPLPGHG